MEAQEFTYDEEAKALTANTFTRRGYTYDGWNTLANPTEGTPGTAYADKAKVRNLTAEPDGNVDLYAQWSLNVYDITYKLGEDAANDADNPATYTVETATFTLKEPTRENYVFSGWTFDGQAPPTKTVSIEKGTIGDKEFTAVWRKTLTAANITDIADQTYTGSALTPVVVVKVGTTTLTVDEDYTVTLPDGGCKNGGEYTITVTGIGNYIGSVEKNFTINPQTLSKPTIVLSADSYEYDGTAKEPAVTVKDGTITIPATEYTVSYSKNTDVGTAEVTITNADGGNYVVSGTATFEITAKVSVIGALEITEDQDGTTAILKDDGTAVSFSTSVDVDELTFSRIFISNTVSTVVLPFDIAEGKYSGGDFYTFNNMVYEDGKWIAEMAKVTSVDAHTPYLFKPTSTELTIDGAVTLKTGDAGSTTQGNWTFKGVYTKKTWADADNKDYGFAGKSDTENNISVGQFVHLGKGVWCNPMRCYLTFSGEKLSKNTEELPTYIEVRLIDETASVEDPAEEQPVTAVVEEVVEEETEDFTTPISEITINNSVKVWSYEKTIFINAKPDMEYTIIDLNGRVLKKSTTHSDREQVVLSHSTDGIIIVRIATKSYKIKY